ncbi:hypothetical protein L1887_63100 [Cichorium endivia]|nr:hypothetical protein L1887_63100 [Cichorium endivia]
MAAGRPSDGKERWWVREAKGVECASWTGPSGRIDRAELKSVQACQRQNDARVQRRAAQRAKLNGSAEKQICDLTRRGGCADGACICQPSTLDPRSLSRCWLAGWLARIGKRRSSWQRERRVWAPQILAVGVGVEADRWSRQLAPPFLALLLLFSSLFQSDWLDGWAAAQLFGLVAAHPSSPTSITSHRALGPSPSPSPLIDSIRQPRRHHRNSRPHLLSHNGRQRHTYRRHHLRRWQSTQGTRGTAAAQACSATATKPKASTVLANCDPKPLMATPYSDRIQAAMLEGSVRIPTEEREMRARELLVFSDSETESNLSRPPSPDRDRYPKHRLSGLQAKDHTIVKHGLEAEGGPEGLAARLELTRENSPYDIRAHLAAPSFAQVGSQLDASANSTNPPSLVSSRRPSATNAATNTGAAPAAASRPSSPPPRAMSPTKGPATTKLSHNTLSAAPAGTFAGSQPQQQQQQQQQQQLPRPEPARVPSAAPEPKEKPKEKESKGMFRRMLSGAAGHSSDKDKDKDKAHHTDAVGSPGRERPSPRTAASAQGSGHISPMRSPSLSRGSTPPLSPAQRDGRSGAGVAIPGHEPHQPALEPAAQPQPAASPSAALRDWDAKGKPDKPSSGSKKSDRGKDGDAKSTASSTLRDMIMGSAPKLSRRGSSASHGNKSDGGSKKGGSTAGGETASLLKKYGVCEKAAIGKGATAVVRLAHKWDRSTEKLYAVKEFRKRRKNETEKEYVKKLTSEFCISSTLHHINIVETVDLVQDENRHWCEVMEYCPGGDLYAAIKRGGMSQREVGVFVQADPQRHCVPALHGGCRTATSSRRICCWTDMATSRSPISACRMCLGCAGKSRRTTPRGCVAPSRTLRRSSSRRSEKKEYDARLVDVWAARGGVLLHAVPGAPLEGGQDVGSDVQGVRPVVRHQPGTESAVEPQSERVPAAAQEDAVSGSKGQVDDGRGAQGFVARQCACLRRGKAERSYPLGCTQHGLVPIVLAPPLDRFPFVQTVCNCFPEMSLSTWQCGGRGEVLAGGGDCRDESAVDGYDLAGDELVGGEEEDELGVFALAAHTTGRVVVARDVVWIRLALVALTSTGHFGAEETGSQGVDADGGVGVEAEFVGEHLGEVVGGGLGGIVGVVELARLDDTANARDVDHRRRPLSLLRRSGKRMGVGCGKEREEVMVEKKIEEVLMRNSLSHSSNDSDARCAEERSAAEREEGSENLVMGPSIPALLTRMCNLPSSFSISDAIRPKSSFEDTSP